MLFFLSFILSLYTAVQPKNKVLINLLFLFGHNYWTKLGVTLTLLFVLFLDVPIFLSLYSWQILPLHFHRSVTGSTAFIFRPLYSQQYYLYLPYTVLIGQLLLYFVHYIHGHMKSQPNVWNEYSAPINALNLGTVGGCVENVLWRAIHLPLPSSVKNVVILCRTNNIPIDTPCDIADYIISIGSIFQKKSSGVDVSVCGLILRDESWLVNRGLIN